MDKLFIVHAWLFLLIRQKYILDDWILTKPNH